MERAAKLLSRSKLASSYVEPEKLAMVAWAVVVGRRLSRRTRAAAFVDGRLIVEVEDEVWRQQLGGMEGQIVSRIHEEMGNAVVRGIHFRIAIPRRGPVREEQPARDEADAIADPFLSLIYKADRKRSSA